MSSAASALDAEGGVGTDAFAIPRAEFAKYYREITGKTAPDGLVEFAIDPKVSKSGNDAYRIVSTDKMSVVPVCGCATDKMSVVPVGAADTGKTGVSPVCVTITGSNLRSVLYGVYDLLARRGGCHWFWDGDIVPKKDTLDFSGLDIREESRFEYRGIRYFAHRGLTRFQAEHWGLEDWKREIDWCVKNRLNLFMLRIGQDDLFQKAFPDVCPYPDPSKPVPEAMTGYNNRSLFWSLQFRGELRKKVMDYAFARGLMAPEDFGTMSHWYSRTRLNAVRPVENPDFGRVLFDNAVNRYCVSHQYEAARYVYQPMAKWFADWLCKAAESGGRDLPPYDTERPELAAALARPLESMKPAAARTKENIRKAFNAFAALAEEAMAAFPPASSASKPACPVVKNPLSQAKFPPARQIMGRDFIPLYPVFDGRSWDEIVDDLGGLPLFREAVLICNGQNRLGVNRSRRANRFRRDFAEPVPESEWRKTSYCLKDFFKESATLQDAIEGKGLPGCPFFVKLREDRPAHCVEASFPLADVQDYNAWKAKRPNYLGVRTLGEYDNDSRIYSEATIPDPALRERIEKAFPPLPPKDKPLARRKAWFEWAKTTLQREQALHFGEKRLWPLMCASPGLAHVWCSLDVPGFAYEATMQCATRGAARPR